MTFSELIEFVIMLAGVINLVCKVTKEHFDKKQFPYRNKKTPPKLGQKFTMFL